MNASSSENNPPPVTKSRDFNYPELLFRIVIVVLLLASAGLTWWSYNRVYAPRLKQSREYNATTIKLSAEVEDLDRRWSPADIEQINNKIGLAEASLFADQPALEAWLEEFRDKLAPVGVDLKTEFEKNVVPAGAERKPHIISGSLFIEMQPASAAAGTASPYQRLLQLTQRLATQEKRADLVELSVDSGTNSIDRAVLGLNFWAAGKESK